VASVLDCKGYCDELDSLNLYLATETVKLKMTGIPAGCGSRFAAA